MNINTLIFDLGGVIIDLNEQATIESFIALSGKEPTEILEAYHCSSFFKDYEKGLISSDDFRKEINLLMGTNLANEKIDMAWNAMLGNIPIERLNFLNKLREKYKVLILSNTNEIHEIAFTKIVNDVSNQSSIHNFADQVFYSHDLHMRKPDEEIFLKTLELSGIKSEEVLFLDDKKENLKGAASVGIQTMHITNPNQIFTVEQYASR